MLYVDNKDKQRVFWKIQWYLFLQSCKIITFSLITEQWQSCHSKHTDLVPLPRCLHITSFISFWERPSDSVIIVLMFNTRRKRLKTKRVEWPGLSMSVKVYGGISWLPFGYLLLKLLPVNEIHMQHSMSKSHVKNWWFCVVYGTLPDLLPNIP